MIRVTPVVKIITLPTGAFPSEAGRAAGRGTSFTKEVAGTDGGHAYTAHGGPTAGILMILSV